MIEAAGGYRRFQYIAVLLYCGLRVGTGGIRLLAHQFVFQAAPEAFHGRVVIAVPTARHGWLYAGLLHQFSIGMGAALAAMVGVVNQAWRGTVFAFEAVHSLSLYQVKIELTAVRFVARHRGFRHPLGRHPKLSSVPRTRATLSLHAAR